MKYDVGRWKGFNVEMLKNCGFVALQVFIFN